MTMTVLMRLCPLVADLPAVPLSRISSRPMSDVEWEAFKAATVRRAMDLRDGE